MILLASFLVAAGFAGLSHGIALRTRQEASMIAVAQFIGLPLLFFSSLLIARALIPGWMQDLSLLNPVEWAVRAARGEALPGTDWGEMGTFLLLLVGFRALTTAFATRSFRSVPAHALAGRTQGSLTGSPAVRRSCRGIRIPRPSRLRGTLPLRSAPAGNRLAYAEGASQKRLLDEQATVTSSRSRQRPLRPDAPGRRPASPAGRRSQAGRERT